MNTQPELNRTPVQEEQPEVKKKSIVRKALSFLSRSVQHNFLLKILALILAVLMWALLIMQDSTLTRTKTFSDVAISVTGVDTLQRNGLIVVSDLSALPTLKMEVSVPQGNYYNATVANYNPRIDLSKITTTGVQTIKIATTTTTAYGTVTNMNVETVEVAVESYITRYRIPVSVMVVGDYPEGYYGVAPSLDPPMIAVSGPESLVRSVSSAVAYFDVSRLTAQEGLMRVSVPLVLTDISGNEIDSALMTMTSESILLDSVIVEQTLYAKKELNLSALALTTGTPAAGYEVKSVTVSPQNIVAAGDSDVLDSLNTLYIDKAIDISGATGAIVDTVDVTRPDEVVYLSAANVVVAVDIGPVVTSRTFENVGVSINNLGDGLYIRMATPRVNVNVTGSQIELEALRVSGVVAEIDLTGYPVGTYDLPVTAKVIDDADGMICVPEPSVITVEITDK